MHRKILEILKNLKLISIIFIQMNFYQQKYFKPYQEIVSSPQHYREEHFRTPSTHKHRKVPKIQYSQKINVEPVWEYLYNQGIRSQKQLMEKHQATKNKIDIQCTFRPMIRQNKRYLVPSHSTFLERNNIWLENKIQRIVKQKEEQINKGLKQCTFSPHINAKSKKVKPTKHENVIHKRTCPNEKLHKSAIKVRQFNETDQNQEPSQSNKKPSYVQLSKAKQMIRNELKRIVL